METVIRNARDLSGIDRSAVERLIGHALGEGHQIVIQVLDTASPLPQSGDPNSDDRLPEWCNVYAGLSDEQVATLDRAISRRLDLTRPSM